MNELLTTEQLKSDAGGPTPRQMQSSDCASVAAQSCKIMIELSKARFEKARHLNSFELINPDLFSDFNTCFPLKQLDAACTSVKLERYSQIRLFRLNISSAEHCL
ncbi:hypothetical protein CHARACLAT_022988 [Characodon lateralis]|uniref:Uncharacterized protein n=1 Tax=Characodon lateralis TaxID=208331 RepID=A0ABU7E6X6_9TELE|nr:hypothetical protein [Characodon lateralis]